MLLPLMMMMMVVVAVSSLLARRRLGAENGDDHFLVYRVAAGPAGRCLGGRRRHEAVGAPLRHDHVHLGVAGRHHPEALLGERVTLQHPVRAAAAVGARLELGEVVGELERRQAARRRRAAVVVRVVHFVRRRQNALRHR